MLRFSPAFLIDSGGGASPLVTCAAARQLIELNRELTEDQSAQLRRHLELCPLCAAEAVFERAIREVVAPAELPAPSRGFEAELLARLELEPEAEASYNPAVDDSPSIPLGWIAAAASLAGLLIWRLEEVTDALRGAGAMIYAKIAALGEGHLIAALDNLRGSYPQDAFIHGNLPAQFALAALTLCVGFAAVRWAAGD